MNRPRSRADSICAVTCGRALANEGTARRNRYQVVPATVRTIAPVQDSQIPEPRKVRLSTTTRMIFSTANVEFSTGTAPGRPTAISALSCITNSDQHAVAATNPRPPRPCPSRPPRCGAHSPRPSRNTIAARPLSPPPIRYAPRIIGPAAAPAAGTNRSSVLIRFSWATPASSIIAEMAAELTPITPGGLSRAASSQ